MSVSSPLNLHALQEALQHHKHPARAYAEALQQGDQRIHELFNSNTPIQHIVHLRTKLVDDVLLQIWQRFFPSAPDELALIAVGGYGRGELVPRSDVDLLILVTDEAQQQYREPLEQFLTFLWDIGLDIGHSVRSVKECVEQSKADVTIATNLMETRLLTGSRSLFKQMMAETGPDKIWPSADFFTAKLEEQRQRHQRFHDTAYRLEPNIKESPGGLRDIQMIGWVVKRHFGASSLADLVEHGFLTPQEHQLLIDGQTHLWKIRYLLHNHSKRREDRLLFDMQRELAHAFGYLDDSNNLAVEQFMQHYYRTVMELQRLNGMLLQLFEEAILHPNDTTPAQPINNHFQVRRGYLEAIDPQLFSRFPPALLEIFLTLSRNPGIRGIGAATIRQIRAHHHLINNLFRDDLIARSLFIDLFREPQGLTHQMRLMHRYGVLAAYLPAFEKITGRMQYDLFHIYTVDEHTLMVIRNLRRFTLPEHQHEHPLCHEIITQLAKPELLMLAGLFHDIAKGRGGDHSELGAEDATQFCAHHGLRRVDGGLVSWLVRNHLIMSMTAQRKDISDPEVIHDFATKVSSIKHLNHLYLFTVADICATNPDLWNSWKNNLLRELYFKTLRALRRGLDNPIDKQEHIQAIQEEALKLLHQAYVSNQSIQRIWGDFGDSYFLRHTADEVTWHTRAILSLQIEGRPLILFRPETKRGSTELFIYTRDTGSLFAQVTSVMDHLNLNIVNARILSSQSGMTLDTFLVLEEDGEPINDPTRIEQIRQTIETAILNNELPSPVLHSLPRRLKHFDVPLQVTFSNDLTHNVTAVSLSASDQPGLLSKIGHSFLKCGLSVHNAKIATIGERVDDIFFITDANNQPITDPERLNALQQMLQQQIGQPEGKRA